MGQAAIIGVDIGTQGTKAALFDKRGRCLAQAFEKSKLHRPRPGVVEEDPEQQFGSVCRTIKSCVRQSPSASIAGIGIDSQMAGILGVGADGRHVTPYDSWLDTRCSPFIDQMKSEAGGEIIRKTGSSPSFNHGPKVLWWKNKRKAVYKRIKAFVQPSGYAAMRLCELEGSDAFIDTTYLHFSGFADNRRRRWDSTLCSHFDVAIEKLPRIVEPHEVVGELAASAARRCGLRTGTPVVAGCGDSAASVLACGATEPGLCVDVAGTASVFAATVRQFVPDRSEGILSCCRSGVPGLWHTYAYINGGGMNLEWFKNEIANFRRRTRRLALEELDALAAKLQRRESDPMFVPHMSGRVSPPTPNLRGAWIGVTRDHTVADLYRAVLEGVVLEYLVYLRVVRKLHPELRLRELRITGGGEISATWNRMKADGLGMPTRRIEDSFGAPMGAALLAGFGVGLLSDLSASAKTWIKLGKQMRPNTSAKKYYGSRFKRYESLLAKLSDEVQFRD